MDNKEFELHLEEQRSILNGINASLGALNDRLSKTLEVAEKSPVKEMIVTGEVQVNTEKSIEVTNLEIIAEAVKLLTQQTTRAIKDTYRPAPSEITVKNIADAQVREVTIKNIATFGEQAAKLVEAAVQKYQPTIKIEKQELNFPRAAKDAIPVRLSDGKSFYNAIASAISAATPNVMKVTNVDGSAIGGSTTTNYITKIDDTTTTDMVYIGKAALTGSAVSTASAVWQIKRIDTSILAMDKKWADGNDSFDNVWDSRSSITYN